MATSDIALFCRGILRRRMITLRAFLQGFAIRAPRWLTTMLTDVLYSGRCGG